MTHQNRKYILIKYHAFNVVYIFPWGNAQWNRILKLGISVMNSNIFTYKKGQSRLHLLRWLSSFGVQGTMLRTFYDSLVALAIFQVVCWSSSISVAGRRLDKLIKKASLTQCNRWERAGRWISCHHCWWRSPTPCRSLSQHWAAPSVTDWYTKCVKGSYRRSFLPAAARLLLVNNNTLPSVYNYMFILYNIMLHMYTRVYSISYLFIILFIFYYYYCFL